MNPEAAAAQSVAIQQQQNEAVELLTQTVYGFLDFTTTIGNTVMVFSPQSALSGTKIKGAQSIRLPQTHAPNHPPPQKKNHQKITVGIEVLYHFCVRSDLSCPLGKQIQERRATDNILPK